MDLHDAFKQAVQKYYEGFDYAATNKAGNNDFKYDFKSLDKLHKEIVPKKGSNMVEDPDLESDPEIDMEGDM